MVGQADSHFYLGAAAQPACANVGGCVPIGLRHRGPLNRALEAIACALLSLLSAFCRDFSRGRGYGPLSSVGYFFMSQGRGSTILGRFYYSPPVDYGLPAPNSLLPIAVNQGLRPQTGITASSSRGFTLSSHLQTPGPRNAQIRYSLPDLSLRMHTWTRASGDLLH
jgi:hypothetical protein